MNKTRRASDRWRRAHVHVIPIVVVTKSPPAATLILVVIDLVSWPDELVEAACAHAGWAVSDRSADLLVKALILVLCTVAAGVACRVRRGRVTPVEPNAGADRVDES